MKYHGYQRGLASLVYNFFDRKTSGMVSIMKLSQTNDWLKNYTNQLHCKDDIAVYTCDYSFLNFLICTLQSRRIKQTSILYIMKN